MLTKPRSPWSSSFLSSGPSANKILKLAKSSTDTSLPPSSALLAGLRIPYNKPFLTSIDDKKKDGDVKAGYPAHSTPFPAHSTPFPAPSTTRIFRNKTFAIEFTSKCGFKDKQRVRDEVTRNGGTISHVLNGKVTAVIVYDSECKDTYRCRKALEFSIPVLDIKYIEDSISAGVAKDHDDYVILGLKRVGQLQAGKISDRNKGGGSSRTLIPTLVNWEKFECIKGDLSYLYQADAYRVPKWAFLVSKLDIHKVCVLEIHVLQTDGIKLYRVATFLYQRDVMVKEEVRDTDGALQAELLFASLYSNYVSDSQYRRLESVPAQRGSIALQQSLFTWTLDSTELSPSVQRLVDMVWEEAVGEVEKNITDISSISRASVEQAEGLLMEMKSLLADSRVDLQQLNNLTNEFYDALPCKNRRPINSLKDVCHQLDMIQLLYDMLGVGEATDWKVKVTTKSKLKSLNCHITKYDGSLSSLGLISVDGAGAGVEIESIYMVTRPAETLGSHSTDTKMLFHASRPENYLGIMSRGLLLPKHVVRELGGKRTDAGNLGHGIYFADDFRTSAEYTNSFTSHTRLMLVCEVATGKSYPTTAKMEHLTGAPSGYDSVMAVGQTSDQSSQFKHNEYCVYTTDRQCLRYIVQYTTAEDRESTPQLTSLPISCDIGDLDIDEEKTTTATPITATPITDDISGIKDVLADILPGLQVEGAGDDVSIPLRSIGVMAKLVDMAAEVTVFQEYRNESHTPIEAKFVFPLSEMAAVCSFEAYINDKHIVGKVKEKEKAQREYRQAVSQGHGAYLMTQDKERPDVFTVSVGNLPPSARVLIKVIYVCELTVQDEKFVFELPTNIAPWTAKQALSERTQNTVDKVNVDSQVLQDIKCSLQVAVQMPFDIRTLDSPSHLVLVKSTATQAMVKMQPNQSLDKGFILTVSLAEVHVPRMIIENHPDDPDSMQACMLSFYPEFECELQQSHEIFILLDMSNSMSSEDITSAKKIALVLLNSLSRQVLFNVITFGSTYTELFPKSLPATKFNIKSAVSHIQSALCRQGNTNLLTPISNLALLSTSSRHRNVVLVSDGHMTNSTLTLQAVSELYGTIRLFTIAVSLNANRYLMRELARVGSGVSEYMNPKARSKWYKQIQGVVEKAKQPLLSQVKVVWQEQNTEFPPPLQAPACIPSVFNGNRIVVYGFASNCFMATLKAVIDGREVSTVVSASPLTASTGLTIHRLAARSVIQDWEHGCLSSDPVEHQTKKKNTKASIIQMSQDYSIITQFTSFVAVEERDKRDQFNIKKTDEEEETQFQNLVAEHMIDLLPYMTYKQDAAASEVIPLCEEINSDEDVEECLYEDLEVDGCYLDIDSHITSDFAGVEYLCAPSDTVLEVDEDISCYMPSDFAMESWSMRGESELLAYEGEEEDDSSDEMSLDCALPISDDWKSEESKLETSLYSVLSLWTGSSKVDPNISVTWPAFKAPPLPPIRPIRLSARRLPSPSRSFSRAVSVSSDAVAPPVVTRQTAMLDKVKKKKLSANFPKPKTMSACREYDREPPQFLSVPPPPTAASSAPPPPPPLAAVPPPSSPGATLRSKVETLRSKVATHSLPLRNVRNAVYNDSRSSAEELWSAFGDSPPTPPRTAQMYMPSRCQSYAMPVASARLSTPTTPPLNLSSPQNILSQFSPPKLETRLSGTERQIHKPSRISPLSGRSKSASLHVLGFDSSEVTSENTNFQASAKGWSFGAPAETEGTSFGPPARGRVSFASSSKAGSSLFGSSAGDSQFGSSKAGGAPFGSSSKAGGSPFGSSSKGEEGSLSGSSLSALFKPSKAGIRSSREAQTRKFEERIEMASEYSSFRQSCTLRKRKDSLLKQARAGVADELLKSSSNSTRSLDYEGSVTPMSLDMPCGEAQVEILPELPENTSQRQALSEMPSQMPSHMQHLMPTPAIGLCHLSLKQDIQLKEDKDALPESESRSHVIVKTKELFVDILTPNDTVDIQPGVYVTFIGGLEKRKLVDYSSLDILWKEGLHVVFDEQESIGRAARKEQINHELHCRDGQIIALKRNIKSLVEGFCSASLEHCLIQAGVKSLGLAASADILCLFLWKILMFVSFLSEAADKSSELPLSDLLHFLDERYLDDCKVAVLCARFPDLSSSPQQDYSKLVQQYSLTLSTLELGPRWSHVIINMMCDCKNHRLALLKG